MAGNVKIIPPLSGVRIRKIGLVARDYNMRFPNGYRDFSYVLPEVLNRLDAEGCDAVLFSLYSIVPRQGYDLLRSLPVYANLKMICLEEFRDCRTGRKAEHYVVYTHDESGWEEHRFLQAFGRINWVAQRELVDRFARRHIPRRVFGSCCILVCGESNGVKYNPKGGKDITDPCGLLAAIPSDVEVILNYDGMAVSIEGVTLPGGVQAGILDISESLHFLR